jgi:hypothetical protein
MDEALLMDRVGQAQALVVNGDREGAQAIYQDLWTDAMGREDHYHACIAAHFMAHAHLAPQAQLDWHLRSLHTAERVDDDRVRAFYPSLHANLGDVYLRLGDPVQARYHVEMARENEHLLANDGYGYMIRSLIARLETATGEDAARPVNSGASNGGAPA